MPNFKSINSRSCILIVSMENIIVLCYNMTTNCLLKTSNINNFHESKGVKKEEKYISLMAAWMIALIFPVTWELSNLRVALPRPADYSGVQLQGCCSQSSLNSNGSLPGAGSHRGVPEQRVASWAACFERLLQDPLGVRYFSVSWEKTSSS